MNVFQIEAMKREVGVKNPYKKSLREDYIPCVVYGEKENLPIRVPRREFTRLFNQSQSNTLFDLKMDGESRKVFIKSFDYSLTKERNLVHIDFFQVGKNKVTLQVPFKTLGVAAGVRLGGYMELYRNNLTVTCDATKIPDFVTYDITSLGVGGRVYLEDVQKESKDFKVVGPKDLCILAVMMSRKEVSQKTQDTVG